MAALETIATRWIEAFNRKDLPGLMALYAEQCTNAQPHLPTPVVGKQAVAEDLGGFFSAFPDGHMDAPTVLVQGDTVAMEWNFTGTHQGPLVGPGGTIPPTGRTLRITGAEFTRHDAEGLIVDERGYFDLVSFMTQLGALPAPTAGTAGTAGTAA
jgi:steroid delta-isomerase-like uncharacterized protein